MEPPARDAPRRISTRRRLLAGLALGLAGALLNLTGVELFPGVELLLGPLAVATAAILFGARAGALAGALSTLTLVTSWAHLAGALVFALEGAFVGALSKRMMPVLADALFWCFGVFYVYGTYRLVAALPAANALALAVERPINALAAVLAVQMTLLAPTCRRRFSGLLPRSLEQAGLGTTLGSALALTAVLPLFLFGTLEGRDRYRSRVAASAGANRAAAELVAARIAHELDHTRRELRVLTEQLEDELESAGRLPGPERLDRILGRLLARTPEALHVHVGDAAGRLVRGLSADGRSTIRPGSELSKIPGVDRVLRERAPVATGFVVSWAERTRAIVVVARPLAAGGAPAGYVAVAIGCEELFGAADASLFGTRELMLLDGSGAVLVARPEAGGELRLDAEAPPSLLEALEEAAAGNGTATWTERAAGGGGTGGAYLIGVATVRDLDWTVVMRQPLRALDLDLQRAYLTLAGGLGTATVLVLLATLAFTALLVRPVRGISAAAYRISRGERHARTAGVARDTPRELRQLGEDFDRMADEVARQLAATEAAIRAKDEFLSIASHELKTPITALRTQLQILRRRLEAEPGERVEKLLKQTDRLTRLVNLLLDAARLGAERIALEPSRMDLAELAARVAEGLVGDSPLHSLALDVEPTVGEWDDLRLEQVVHNLVANAIKFSPWGGEIQLRVRPLPGGGGALEVRDRGMGVDPAKAEALFGRFTRGVEGVNVAGLGVGLYVARELVERHGGRITLEPREGGGALARVVLPARVPEAEGPPARGT